MIGRRAQNAGPLLRPAGECEHIGLCEYVAEDGQSRKAAEAFAQQIARFPQSCLRADRRSAIGQQGLPVRDALVREWRNGQQALIEEGIGGAARFTGGLGRHGDFTKL